ncbi:alpha/beta fold hydrolase [Allobranchiibius sp. CTAmp26]|uniref:alpha/beta fold hydrolase n=1 Tax=Allobranchiibius sp. CTAmp26 TaxID=2815214 RepID=UPI001FB81569|nr:alpha/beta hydrolase [Allobranchiibius sp. CTAmp26]
MLERGELAGVPFASAGAGRPLVVLPGLSPMTGVESDQLVRGSMAPVQRLADRRRLVVLNRWPNLPRDLTMAALARGHADAIRAGFPGESVDVLGTSTGGSIAQQMAVEYPDVVRKLVLLSAACRLGPLGRRDQARVAGLLRTGSARAACRSAGASLAPRLLRPLGGAVGWLSANRVLSSTQSADDLLATLDAEDGFDLASCNGSIRAPTLIVAGGRDRFYSRALFNETEQLIPRSQLYTRPRRGHSTVTFDPRAGATIRGFLNS